MNNNTAYPQTTSPVVPTVTSDKNTSQSSVSTGSSHGKEFEAVKISPTEAVQEVSKEPEIPEEVEKAGVMKVSETIELPPDVKKLGVVSSGASTPITVTPVLSKVVLPISDQQVIVGLHSKVTSAFRWLSTWCIRKLKKAHIALKVIHGKIVRINK